MASFTSFLNDVDIIFLPTEFAQNKVIAVYCISNHVSLAENPAHQIIPFRYRQNRRMQGDTTLLQCSFYIPQHIFPGFSSV